MAFLPQRPYLPLGTLRNALSYPSPPDAFPDADVRQALERCDLGNLIAKLDQVERWDKELSLGEQERLAFARLLLHKPGWVFLDEATAALDEDNWDCLVSSALAVRHVMPVAEQSQAELQSPTVSRSELSNPDRPASYSRALSTFRRRRTG